MPVLIPLAMNIGFYIEYLIRQFKELKDKRETVPVYFNFGLIALIGIAFPVLAYYFLKDNLTGYWFWYISASIVLFGIGLLIINYLIKKNMKYVFLLTVSFFVSVLLLALPLSRTLIDSNYKPITQLKAEADNDQLNIYGLNYISPEMIWEFGTAIPAINGENGKINFPTENTFGLLANGISPKDDSKLKALYTIKKMATYDLNQVGPDSKKYNGRLMRHYYILTKK